MRALRAWVRAAGNRAIVGRALITAVVVGTLLTAINQGDALLGGRLEPDMAWRIGLTFVVPFFVSLVSSVQTIRGETAGGYDPAARG